MVREEEERETAKLEILLGSATPSVLLDSALRIPPGYTQGRDGHTASLLPSTRPAGLHPAVPLAPHPYTEVTL